MFEPTSRYSDLPTAELIVTGADGEVRTVTYVRRRLLPPLSPAAGLSQHTVKQGERLDHLAARRLGDPTQFWRICDVNRALRPQRLTERPGAKIEIPMPGGL